MLQWLAKIVGSVFGLKLFFSGVMISIVAVVLYNLFVEMVEEVFTFIISYVNGSSLGGVTSPTITGFAGWFLAQVKFPECFAVVVSAVVIRFILRKIPFLRW